MDRQGSLPSITLRGVTIVWSIYCTYWLPEVTSALSKDQVKDALNKAWPSLLNAHKEKGFMQNAINIMRLKEAFNPAQQGQKTPARDMAMVLSVGN